MGRRVGLSEMCGDVVGGTQALFHRALKLLPARQSLLDERISFMKSVANTADILAHLVVRQSLFAVAKDESLDVVCGHTR
jgi:hypothetical protein